MARYYWMQTFLNQIQLFTSLHEIEVLRLFIVSCSYVRGNSHFLIHRTRVCQIVVARFLIPIYRGFIRRQVALTYSAKR